MARDIKLAKRAHAIFTLSLELDAPARRAFAKSECAEDAALMSSVLALIDAADASDSFMDAPALGIEAEGAPRATQIPDAVGDYLVVGVLGVGGMATVYEAIQEDPKRRVALKVMRQSMTTSDAYLRFRFETETLGRLQHPGIAQIYEAGAAQLGDPSPVPFFAMELISDALPITEYANRHGMSLRERIIMFTSVCDAVHHGHQHGVIHRDLKPANVLVDREGRAKVIDFGIARTTESSGESLTAVSGMRQLIGTLNYMSPEQCGCGADLDIRTDVYSLGVMLYELACGRLPHSLADLPIPAALQKIMHDAPDRPVFSTPTKERDLEAIILKAIEKDPERRYNSAAAIAADLRRSLNYQTIEARRPGVIDHCRLFARRHRTLVGVGAALVIGMVMVAGISTAFALRLATEVKRRGLAEQETARERDQARWQAYIAQIAGALSAMNSGEFQQMRTRLSAAECVRGGWEWGFLARLSDRSVGTIVAHDAMILEMAVNDEWTRYATGASDGTVRLWDVSGGTQLATYRSDSASQLRGLAFTPDARHLLTGDEDGVVRLLDAATLREVEVVAKFAASVRTVSSLVDGRVAVTTSSGSAMLISLSPRITVSLADDQPGGVRGLEGSPDGETIATFNDEGHIWLRSANDVAPVSQFVFPGRVNQVRFSRDSQLVAAAGGSGSVFVWSVGSDAPPREFVATQSLSTIGSLAFSNDGSMLAMGLVHRGIVVMAMEDGAIVGRVGGHTDAVSFLKFRPDDQLLVSASWDRTIRSWRTSEFTPFTGGTRLEGHRGFIRGVAFSPDGSVLASVARDGNLRLWDPDLAQPIARIRPDGKALNALDFSPDSRFIAIAGADDHVRILETRTARTVAEFPGHESSSASVAFDPSGTHLATGGEHGTVHVWNISSREQTPMLGKHAARVNSVRFSPDGAMVASGSRDGSVRLWDARTGAELHFLDDHFSDVFAVLFSRDGKLLFSGSRDQTVRVWNVETGECVKVLEGHGQYVTCLTLSPDGTRLAAGSWFGEIVLFDVGTFDQIASFRAHDAAIRGVAFSPDGRWLASGSYDASVRLFDSATREESDAARERAFAAQSAAKKLVAPVVERAKGNTDAILRGLTEAGVDLHREPWVWKSVLSAVAPDQSPMPVGTSPAPTNGATAPGLSRPVE